MATAVVALSGGSVVSLVLAEGETGTVEAAMASGKSAARDALKA